MRARPKGYSRRLNDSKLRDGGEGRDGAIPRAILLPIWADDALPGDGPVGGGGGGSHVSPGT